MNILIGILIPFIGTSLGAACVYLMKKEMNKNLNKILLGFASGVMIAASVWSLIIPSIDMSQHMGEIIFYSISSWSDIRNDVFIFFGQGNSTYTY